jgi:hypothetical protein
MTELLRYVDASRGPIICLESELQPSGHCPQLWCSRAKLHPSCHLNKKTCSVGWGQSKEQSQTKAIVEAVERWAFYSLKNSPKADFKTDPSSTGFAAAPKKLGQDFVFRNGGLEAVERWMMARIADGESVWLRAAPAERLGNLRSLFLGNEGQLLVYKSSCLLPRPFPSEVAHFALVIFRFSHGGIVPGTACAKTLDEAIKRAGVECFNRLRKFRRLQEGLESLDHFTTARLWNFATESKDVDDVFESIRRGLKEPAKLLEPPRVKSADLFDGPWNPEVLVGRVLLRGVPSMCEGGATRFVY